MFRFKTEQKVFTFAGIKIWGQPGENPPLMISSMFHNKDKIMEDRKGNFDRRRAAELINRHTTLRRSTGFSGSDGTSMPSSTGFS
jgi:tetrahydromethanopterin S-methyltransferase subunit H